MEKSADLDMSKFRVLFYCLCLPGLLMLSNCRTPIRSNDAALLAYFQSQPLGDTLHIEISNEAPAAGDTIPNRLFFTHIPADLLQQIDYLADSSQSVVLSRQKFNLDHNIAAYWVEIRQFWFQHHCLFLYNASKKTFTDRITVAEWYGGDGGQILTGSWIFDFNGDGKKDIVRREIQHSLIPTEDEPLEQIHESASLLLWKNGRFENTPFQDTTTMNRRFPIHSFW